MQYSPSITVRSLLSRRESKAIIVVLILLIVWGILGGSSNEESAQNAQEDHTMYVPEVKVKQSVAEAFVRELTLSAVTENNRAVELKAQTEGVVAIIKAKEGAPIYAGEVIVTLADDARSAKLAEAQAELTQRQLEYKAAKALAKSGHRAETALAESYFFLKQAETNLKMAELDAAHASITSPFSGILNRIYVHEGDAIKSLDTTVASVIDYHPILAVGYVPEKWRGDITEGSAASVKLVDGSLVYGVVHYVSHKAEDATRTFRVEVALDNPNGMISSGVSSEIYIPLGNIKAHHVPSSALSLSDDGQLQLKYVNDQHKVQASVIEIAGEDKEGLWVTGLPEHVDIITYGQAYVRSDDTVNVSAKR